MLGEVRERMKRTDSSLVTGTFVVAALYFARAVLIPQLTHLIGTEWSEALSDLQVLLKYRNFRYAGNGCGDWQ